MEEGVRERPFEEITLILKTSERREELAYYLRKSASEREKS